MKRYLITKWLGVDVILADSIKLYEYGVEFFINGCVIATTSSKDVKEIPMDETIISI